MVQPFKITQSNPLKAFNRKIISAWPQGSLALGINSVTTWGPWTHLIFMGLDMFAPPLLAYAHNITPITDVSRSIYGHMLKIISAHYMGLSDDRMHRLALEAIA